ncbi:oxygenase MpaB family protein [Chryseosolibacter indicus]|uniref:DUF2236 domain-containing protein n=1 Tax=Chryseosolibacter indicus TaxID=2782351 RepID=A0ABS5VV66_9BACT|nr:oxygenase MpaB family protein [Chryseosolibacter indicus]MBT1705101.1 DUF2236 domain-containing protein [Chryseosolibacter indicus]
MSFFVKQNSIVRTIWGRHDTVLFIFGGASAEFALNKAVDWLYFTGRLPADPIGRLFSTVTYARKIVFSPEQVALQVIDRMRAIHGEVENKRNATIPDWAYRDVLFMLIHYSIASFELLERKLAEDEKEEVFRTFYRVGDRMGLKELPLNYNDWLNAREQHLNSNLQKSKYTKDLFKQYKKHLGPLRYQILVQAQILVIPERVRSLLNFKRSSWLKPFVPVYKITRKLKIDWYLISGLLPTQYREEIKALNVV